ncbi:hypothetical protein CI109_100385 [Kwoniella shandongensis]|uniref:Uncharacterized protein n=1 Tax=Kwoniella shandongensis TaxID=1734106 RepID=A0A5M6C7Q6_9TREE|nr:uncharacterized protein CI109_001772 [Kwoniella shandongensis]KAA5529832.1 hypothetical protein CI109_001772 [Kwoniella shandongensis]
MPPRRAAPPASPARSTRSARSGRGRDDDDWEGESVTSSSFRVPTSRNGKIANGNGLIGFKDTSVNIAAAFNAAQSGISLPPNPERSFPKHKSASTSRSQNFQSLSPPPPMLGNHQRAQSPAEQLASTARALSPVRYFLRPTEDGDGDGDASGDYASFSSLGGGGGAGNHSGETSHNYEEEEEYVRQAQAQAEAVRAVQYGGSGPRGSDSKKRRGKAAAEDMPYRPAEDNEGYYDSDDSGGEGEGVVRRGALEGRSGTRGKRQEKGEGYLGMGLGLQPRQRRKGRKSDEGADSDGSGEEYDESQQNRGWTPTIEINGHSRRSPTPAQLLRALSPRVDRRSPAPTFHPRRRRPSSLRTIVTNILHGVVIGLQFAVELATNLLRSIIVRPGQTIFGSGKGFLRRVKRDWWKWLGAMLALSLALRILDAPWRSRGIYKAPDAPPGTTEEMSVRLTNLEQATAALSDMLKAITEGESENKQSAHTILDRMSDLETAVMLDKKRVEALRGDSGKDVKALQHSLNDLKAEIQSITSTVDSHEKSIAAAHKSVKSIEHVDRDIQQLRTRVDKVEKAVKDALDDGRLLAALEKVLPDNMPIRVNSRGTIDIEPSFWAEMKKVMMGRTETEALVKRMMSESTSSTSPQINEKKVEEWTEKTFDRKAASGEFLSKDSFTSILNYELNELRRERAEMPAPSKPSGKSKSSASSSVTIKSNKGDDLTSLFNELIDAALLKYSKDTIARTDYALFTAGARVIPQLTSDTLVLQTASGVGKWIMGSKDVQGRPPATALHPDISVGSCWPFKGEQGSLGVMLTRRVVVSDITIEHAPSELALDTSTAPRVIQVMGILDDEEDKEKFAQYWAQKEDPAAQPDYLPLGSFTYDPAALSHIQTFPVASDIVDLGIKVGVVVFKVESNWGGHFTCMYRVRVHGDINE